ncbi:hypothetical protein [Microbacterium sp. NPDC058345]|uniref:hypothetical protein n=1 Tax=Microbacterium sp. NPDC058345 TaxID=3346455 RepID=UPI003667DDED
MRRVLAVVGLALAGLLAAACSPDTQVCPAIGWNNHIEVDATAFGQDAFVQLCTEAGCSPQPGAHRTLPTDLSVPSPDAGAFSVGMTAPESVTIRVYDATGALLHESERSVDWTHSPGPCGGPSTATPVVLAR